MNGGPVETKRISQTNKMLIMVCNDYGNVDDEIGDMRGYVTVEDFARRGNIGRGLGDFKIRNNARVSLKDYRFDIQALNVILSSSINTPGQSRTLASKDLFSASRDILSPRTGSI